MNKITIGGDRLGAGKQMQVEVQNFERSTHNLGFIVRTTQAPGTIVPILNLVALPGDTWQIKMDALAKTLPTIGPLFGSNKLQLDCAFAPVRLYNGLMHNNTLNIGRKISQIKLPLMEFTATKTHAGAVPNANLDTCQVHPSCILAYIGIKGIGSWDGQGDAPLRKFNITALLAYWDFYKNYYANKQEEIGAVLHTPAFALITPLTIQTGPAGTAPGAGTAVPVVPGATLITLTLGQQIWLEMTATQDPIPDQILFNTSIGLLSLQQLTGGVSETATPDYWTGAFNGTRWGTIDIYSWQMIDDTTANPGKPSVVTFPLTEIDHMRNAILTNTSTAPFIVNTMGNFAPYNYLFAQPNGIPNILSSQEGLALKTYQNDLFNNWLNTDWIDGVDGVTAITAIDTSGGSFTIDQFNISSKVYNMLNKIAMSGGTLDDWQEVVYGHKISGKTEIPMYMGGLSKEIIFNEVVSNSQSEDQPLGTLAGRGNLSQKHKGGYVEIKVNEIGYIQVYASITPRIDYSQGNAWDINLTTLDDFHKPDLDEIGFEDSINEYRAWWSTNYDTGAAKWTQTSAGKVPAWMNYMTNTNKTYGNFAQIDNQMFMTNNRRYVPATDAFIDIADLTTYIDPSKFNFIFAQTELDAQNYWMQYGFDITVRRKMSGKIMPAL
jgi:hypothetical protein